MPIEITGQSGNANPLKNNGESSEVTVSRSTPTASQEQTGKPSAQDTVSLTETATRLQKLENSLAELPVTDTQRVESIKQAVTNGTYEVDSTRVAEKMIQLERELSK